MGEERRRERERKGQRETGGWAMRAGVGSISIHKSQMEPWLESDTNYT